VANEVYVNGREIACKAASGKSICAFPDVCFTPPQTPATPPGVPIPYPNTGLASDATDGSKKVKISGKEIMLKNKSCFKKSSGDEAGSAPKKGVITSKITGKVFFNSWSMDVKIEGENADRHLDITTHNHASQPGDTPPWIYQDMMAFNETGGKVCEDQEKDAEDKCKDAKPHESGKGLDCSDDCKAAKACVLKPKKQDKKLCCHPETTGHHLVEVHCFSPSGKRGKALSGFEDYKHNNAPCACASQARNTGTHGIHHKVQGMMEGAYNDRGAVLQTWPGQGALNKATGKRDDAVSRWNYKEARDSGVLAHKTAFPHCNAKCTEKELDKYHKDKCGMHDDTPLRSDPGVESRSAGELDEQQQEMVDHALDAIKNRNTSDTF